MIERKEALGTQLSSVLGELRQGIVSPVHHAIVVRGLGIASSAHLRDRTDNRYKEENK